jgi:aspartyl-tRNA(Asn)/glutamyl-tRNA(Gln) amidotransferase subunit C
MGSRKISYKSRGLETTNIDVDMVKHVAQLVRVGITDEEAAAFSPQLTAIIDYLNLLNEVDTSQTPPATQLTGVRNMLREDEVTPSMKREDFLTNAPQREGEFVKVPMVLGEE